MLYPLALLAVGLAQTPEGILPNLVEAKSPNLAKAFNGLGQAIDGVQASTTSHAKTAITKWTAELATSTKKEGRKLSEDPLVVLAQLAETCSLPASTRSQYFDAAKVGLEALGLPGNGLETCLCSSGANFDAAALGPALETFTISTELQGTFCHADCRPFLEGILSAFTDPAVLQALGEAAEAVPAFEASDLFGCICSDSAGLNLATATAAFTTVGDNFCLPSDVESAICHADCKSFIIGLLADPSAGVGGSAGATGLMDCGCSTGFCDIPDEAAFIADSTGSFNTMCASTSCQGVLTSFIMPSVLASVPGCVVATEATECICDNPATNVAPFFGQADPSTFSSHSSCASSADKAEGIGCSSSGSKGGAGDSEGGGDPCFPSSAKVTLADGSAVRLDALKEGDMIVAATVEGNLTVDTVSLLSIAKPEARAPFLAVTTAAGQTLHLTAGHHLPVGATCCSTLRQAKDLARGDTVWVVDKGAAVQRTVAKIATASDLLGLHSPVLVKGGFPVVDGFVTSFDSMDKVTLAKHALAPLLTTCKATGTCDSFKDLFLGNDKMYIA